MKRKKLQLPLLALAIGVSNVVSAQLYIDNAQFLIQPGATVTVQGDITSNTDILGTGKVVLGGTANQNVNMGGFTIPNLEISNTANATLTGSAKIGSSIVFTNGKLILGANNLTLAATATTSGQGTSKFVETNSTGQLIKAVTANLTTYEMPVGVGTSYRPAFLTTTGTYASASVGVRVNAVVDPNKPPMITNYLKTHWPVTKTGVTGTVTIAGQYIDAGDVTGAEDSLKGYFYNGADWSSAGETHSAALNRVTATISANTGDVYGMNKFVLLKAKAFLQAAYTAGGTMTDNLRTPTNLIPESDPYRTAPYSTNYTHIKNSVAEVAPTAVFANQVATNDNIVDWVFLELRTTTAGNTTPVETRSALLKRNGDIVDIDGTSPITFNNLNAGSYYVAVRHRSHLGISADATTNSKNLTEQKSTVSPFDFTTATDATIFGTAAAYNVSSDAKVILWAGNANHNNNVRYTGIGNDKDVILSDLGGASSLTNYLRADLNMNRTLRYTGIGNDKDWLLANALAGSSANTRTQQLP